MYKSKVSLLALLSIFVIPVVAQDDEARVASGLPQMIGRRACSNPAVGSDASLSGSVVVAGMPQDQKGPALTVTLLANGTIVQKERVKARDAFHFACIPRHGVTLIVEADGLEIGSYPLGTLNPPPSTNRHDVYLTWAQLGSASARQNEIASIRNSYSRTEANQKAFDKAVASLKAKKADNSIKLFKGVVENDPNDFVAWTELGNLYFTENNVPEAESAYAKAVALKPDFLPALMNQGKFFISQKKADQAVETLTRAVAADPKSADANHYLGEAYLLARKGSAAVGYLEKALEIAPVEKAEIHLRLGALYNAANLKERAAAEYRKFLDKVPNHPDKEKFEKYISENTPKK
jgi:tetratricopeptide (TPR) repeat protein